MRIGIYQLPYIMENFNQENTAIQSNFVIDNTAVVEEMLFDNRLHIGFVEGLVHPREIVDEKVMDNEIWLICSSRHRWAFECKRLIDPVEISGEPLILREQVSGTREVVEKKLQEHHVRYEAWHVLNNTETIKKLLLPTLGLPSFPKWLSRRRSSMAV